MKKSFIAQYAVAIVLLASSLVVTSAGATTLVGAATLVTSDDLTVIADGTNTFEFLDLTTTVGMSQAAALAVYSGSGFTVATSLDLARLFNAFGFNFEFSTANAVLTVSAAQAANFSNYLGTTYSDASLFSFIDARYGQSLGCIAVSDCLPNGFLTNSDQSAGGIIIGVMLVRAGAATSDVPEPGSIALLSLGLAGFAVARRSRK